MNVPPAPLNVGVIGLGMMGQTHLDAYAGMDGVRVRAIADRNAMRRSGQQTTALNVDDATPGAFDFNAPGLKKYADGLGLISDPAIDVVDICVPTPGHLDLGLASLRAGKHTLIEKPLARTHAQAVRLADAAERAWDTHRAVSMCAMCMRFWPGWDWLRDVVAAETYGPVRAATFRRVSSFPGGRFYADGDASGGAILDLHLHDADFIRHAFGPVGLDVDRIDVQTRGYARLSGQPDHVLTSYRFPPNTPGLADDALICAEGGWDLADGFGFSMRYAVNFEHATADFDLARGDRPVHLYQRGQTTEVDLPGGGGTGYARELAYFVDCVRAGRPAGRVTLRDAAQSVKLIERELASMPG